MMVQCFQIPMILRHCAFHSSKIPKQIRTGKSNMSLVANHWYFWSPSEIRNSKVVLRLLVVLVYHSSQRHVHSGTVCSLYINR